MTVWPASGVNSADDERPVGVDGQALLFLRSATAGARGRDRRWLRRYGRPRRELRLGRLLPDGYVLELGAVDSLPLRSGHGADFVRSPDGLVAHYTEATAPSDLRGRRARRASLDRLFEAGRGPTAFNLGRELPGQAPGARSLHPALSPDGRTLIFASDRPGGFGGLDLWSMSHDGDLLWGEPVNLGPAINSPLDEAHPHWHPDGLLYFASRGHDATAAEGDPDYDLFVARGEADAWSDARRLPPPLNGPADDVALAFDSNGRSGYFASARVGAIGGLDVFGFAFGPRRALGPPQPLSIVAVDADGARPLPAAQLRLLNADAVTLAEALAASLVGGVEGVALDRLDPIGLGDSARYVASVQPGRYFARVSAAGYDDIDTAFVVVADSLSLVLPARRTPPCASIDLVVLDAASFAPVIGAEIAIVGDAGAEPRDGRVVELPAGGSARVCLPCGDRYAFVATGPDARASDTTVVELPIDSCGGPGQQLSLTMYIDAEAGLLDDGTRRAAFAESDMAGGADGPRRLAGADASAAIDPWLATSPTVIALPSVRYDYGSVNLSKEARSDLGHLAELMTANPEMRVTLGSHTDSQSSLAFNAKLSGRRAAEAARFLVEELDVPEDRVRAVGYGESRLLNDCRDGVPCSAAEHAVNRRTEIAVVGVDDPGAIAEELTRRAETAKAEGYVNAPGLGGPRPAAARGSGASPIAPAEYTPPEPRFRADYVADPARPFWVIAGTFRRDANAERREALFRELGYDGVEVVRFDGSGRRAVVVGKFGSLAGARQFSRAVVEAHRVAAYVRRVD